MHRAGYGKNTFYNNLRQYAPNSKPFLNRKKSHTATFAEKKDDFSASQDHFNPKYKREMQLVLNYQMMMDDRLSKPKKTVETEINRSSNNRLRVFKNSSPEMQEEFQASVYRDKNPNKP